MDHISGLSQVSGMFYLPHYSVAADTINDILKYNNIQTPDAIFVGQVLTVPAGSAETQYHVARPGDSLWIIAQMHGTTVENLSRLNRLSNPNVIYPGQIIKVR